MRTRDPSTLRRRVSGIDLNISHRTPSALSNPTHLLRVASIRIDVNVEDRETLHKRLVVAWINIELGLDVTLNVIAVINTLFATLRARAGIRVLRGSPLSRLAYRLLC